MPPLLCLKETEFQSELCTRQKTQVGQIEFQSGLCTRQKLKYKFRLSFDAINKHAVKNKGELSCRRDTLLN